MNMKLKLYLMFAETIPCQVDTDILWLNLKMYRGRLIAMTIRRYLWFSVTGTSYKGRLYQNHHKQVNWLVMYVIACQPIDLLCLFTGNQVSIHSIGL